MGTKPIKAGICYGGAGHWACALMNNGIYPSWYYEKWIPAVKCFKLNWENVLVFGDIDSIIYGLGKNSGTSVIVGSPHCNGLSNTNPANGVDHPANQCMFDFIKTVKCVKPTAFVMEESHRLLSCEKFRDLRHDILCELTDIGYYYHGYIADSHDYGSPQIRKRAYIIGFKTRSIQNKFVFPSLMESPSAISVLPKGDYKVNVDYHRRPRKNERGPWGMYKSYTQTRIVGETCYTITMQACRDMRHPSMRFLSWQEIAALMGFPSDYKFYKNFALNTNLIAKGVDIRFTTRIVKSVLEALQ